MEPVRDYILIGFVPVAMCGIVGLGISLLINVFRKV